MTGLVFCQKCGQAAAVGNRFGAFRRKHSQLYRRAALFAGTRFCRGYFELGRRQHFTGGGQHGLQAAFGRIGVFELLGKLDRFDLVTLLCQLCQFAPRLFCSIIQGFPHNVRGLFIQHTQPRLNIGNRFFGVNPNKHIAHDLTASSSMASTPASSVQDFTLYALPSSVSMAPWAGRGPKSAFAT